GCAVFKVTRRDPSTNARDGIYGCAPVQFSARDPGAAQHYFDSFNKRLRARSSVRRSLGVRLPMPDLAILSRIGSTASEMSSSSRRVGTDLGRTLNFGLGCNRALKFSHQINSGPTPRRRTKQNPRSEEHTSELQSLAY